MNKVSKNKTAIITGAGSGIGKEISILLYNLGYNVILIGRDIAKLNLIKKKFKNKKKFLLAQCDLTYEDQIELMIQKVKKKFGRIDILINSAGVTASGNIDTINKNEWENIHQNNGTSTFLTIKHVVPYMKKRKYGKIVNISSIAGRFRGRTSGLHYAYTKAGIIGFTRQLAAELGKFNINVNCFCPSQTMTPMLKALISKKQKKELEKIIPLKRIAKPLEQAQVLLFLVSDQSSYITGAAIDSNGGQF